MQQAWRFRLWGTGLLQTCQGKTVEIVDPGRWNKIAGPDFIDARIKVDDMVYGGCIEIHRHASDWYRHGHETDPAYDNVVLHVVGEDDCRINDREGREILQATMSIGAGFAGMLNGLLADKNYVLPMCGNALPSVMDIFKTDWITALAFERLNRKADDILRQLERENGDWLYVVFITLARGLGFGTNAENMERVARSVSLKTLLKHSDNVEAIEAILTGQAGLLDTQHPADGYEARLGREYAFYSAKYGLTPIDKPIWRMSARNMANTPYRRLALLAQLVSRYGSDIGTKLSEPSDIDAVRRYLNVEPSDYWSHTTVFGRRSSTKMSALGRQSQDLLIINVIVPLVYARGLITGNYELFDRAVQIWESVEGEQNSITRGFKAHGIEANDAFTSQALIQLHREYCERRRCPECRLGHRLLSRYVRIGHGASGNIPETQTG